jgi:hypothetical protein
VAYLDGPIAPMLCSPGRERPAGEGWVLEPKWDGIPTVVHVAEAGTDKVERSIEASILSQRHLPSTVRCPVNIVQKAGVVFKCVATVRGRNFQVVVTETDGSGHVVYVVT